MYTIHQTTHDIFVIWTGTAQELVDDLNAFHPNLRFTYEYNHQFLDLTMAQTSPTQTFWIPRPSKSSINTFAHPKNVFKSIIRGECVRYARTNTTQEDYFASLHRFKQRNKVLLKQIISQNYSQIKFICHPTLRNTLVHARLKPTDEQFIDNTLAPTTLKVQKYPL